MCLRQVAAWVITSHVRACLSIRLIGIPGGEVNSRRIETDAIHRQHEQQF